MSTRSDRRSRGGSLTDLLAEATGGPLEPSESTEPEASRAPRTAEGGGGERPGPPPDGHVRQSDGSYVRADGARRVSLQLKMDPDDKRALKVQAAEAGLSPAEYVAQLVRADGR